MPQNNPLFLPAVTPSLAKSPLHLGAGGELLIGKGKTPALDITAAAVIKATPGRLMRISVLVAGSTTGTANDVATTAGAAVANQFFTIPTAVGTYDVDWPCATGIVVVPGTGQTLAVSFA